MNRLTLIAFVLVILAIGGGAAWYLTVSSRDALGTAEPAPATPQMDEGLAIYTNGPYGFSVFYPEASAVSYTFDPQYHLGSAWRANALPESEGTPVVSIVPYSVSRDASYPRYYTAMVRIGASSDPDELARCEERADEQGETQLPDAIINGHAWKAFSFQSAGMMQYAEGVSYRTVYEGKCIAMEKVRTGSNYREDVRREDDIPQETLDAEYAKLGAIVQSFAFAR